jgi:hypothetical protein
MPVSAAQAPRGVVTAFKQRAAAAESKILERKGTDEVSQSFVAIDDGAIKDWFASKYYEKTGEWPDACNKGYARLNSMTKADQNKIWMYRTDDAVLYHLTSLRSTSDQSVDYEVVFVATYDGPSVKITEARCSCLNGGNGLCKHCPVLMFLVRQLKFDAKTQVARVWGFSDRPPSKAPVHMLQQTTIQADIDRPQAEKRRRVANRHDWTVVRHPSDPKPPVDAVQRQLALDHAYSKLLTLMRQNNKQRHDKGELYPTAAAKQRKRGKHAAKNRKKRAKRRKLAEAERQKAASAADVLQEDDDEEAGQGEAAVYVGEEGEEAQDVAFESGDED